MAELQTLLSPGDVVVDGGNSRYTDDRRHAEALAPHEIGFVDAGVSGGVWGLTEGYALMVGGAVEHVAAVQPFFDVLKPAGSRKQVLVDMQFHLAANLQAGSQEHVQRGLDGALPGILDWYHAKVGMPGFYFLEYFFDARQWQAAR